MTDLRTQAGIDAADDAPFFEMRYGKLMCRYFRTAAAARKYYDRHGGRLFEVPSGGGTMWRVDNREQWEMRGKVN